MKHLLSITLLIITAICTDAQTRRSHVQPDTTAITAEAAMPDTIIRLTDEDYREVAERLGVETAAMKAVVDIEAGVSHQGFFAPGKPVINFDVTMFRRFAGKRGINLAKYRSTHAEVFSAVNPRRHGSTQAAQHARLRKARSIDERTAVEGTFWGMFQIGGFNWKKCGASSLDDFVTKMCRSEREQLELFAGFLIATGLDKHLRTKNWAAFSRGYNGPSYAKRHYHTRMAAAYAKHKSREKKQSPAAQ